MVSMTGSRKSKNAKNRQRAAAKRQFVTIRNSMISYLNARGIERANRMSMSVKIAMKTKTALGRVKTRLATLKNVFRTSIWIP